MLSHVRKRKLTFAQVTYVDIAGVASAIAAPPKKPDFQTCRTWGGFKVVYTHELTN